MTQERKDPAPKGPGVMAATVHDPLCACNESDHTHYEYAPSRLCTYCRCALIGNVRKDMLHKCIAALQLTITSAPTLGQKRALAALHALSATADSGTNVSERRSDTP